MKHKNKNSTGVGDGRQAFVATVIGAGTGVCERISDISLKLTMFDTEA